MSEEKEECKICFEETSLIELKCECKLVCKTCIDICFKTSDLCPFCRRKVRPISTEIKIMLSDMLKSHLVDIKIGLFCIIIGIIVGLFLALFGGTLINYIFSTKLRVMVLVEIPNCIGKSIDCQIIEI